MDARILTPDHVLQPFISHYVYCDMGNPGKWSQSSYASPGCPSLSIVTKGQEVNIREDGKSDCNYESVTFVGQATRFKKVSFYNRLKSFFVIFQPWGAYQILGIHQGECRDTCINFTDLLGSGVRYLEEEMADQSRAKDVKSVLEKFFIQRLSQSKEPAGSTRLAHITKQIRLNCHHSSLIKEICRREGFSIRTLERKMKKIVGLTPKRYQRIMRFNRVLQYIKENGAGHSWSRIAGRFGYYDQTHFIKEFKLFYGKTPTQYSMDDNRFLSDITLLKR